MSCEQHRQKALKAIAAAYPGTDGAELESVFRAGKLQRADIGSLHSALREAEHYEVWQTAMETARDLFGDKVHRVEVECGDGNDEQLGPEVIDLIVYDKNGKELDRYDMNSPYFQNTIAEEMIDPEEADYESMAADHISAMFDHIQGAQDGESFYANEEPPKPPVVYLAQASAEDDGETPVSVSLVSVNGVVGDFLGDKDLQESIEDDDTSLLDYFNDEDIYKAWVKGMDTPQAAKFEEAWGELQANHDNDYYIEQMTQAAKEAVTWAKARVEMPSVSVAKRGRPSTTKAQPQPKLAKEIRALAPVNTQMPFAKFVSSFDAKTLARVRAGKIKAREDQKAAHQIALAVYRDKRDRLMPSAKKALSRQYPPREFQRLMALSKSKSVKISQLGEVSKFELALAQWALKPKGK